MQRDPSLLRFATLKDIDEGLLAWAAWYSQTPSAEQLAALVVQLESARSEKAPAEPVEA